MQTAAYGEGMTVRGGGSWESWRTEWENLKKKKKSNYSARVEGEKDHKAIFEESNGWNFFRFLITSIANTDCFASKVLNQVL